MLALTCRSLCSLKLLHPQRHELHHLLLPLPCPSTQQPPLPPLPTLPQVTADLRTINSTMFATRYSLRFPIIKRLRPDKCPAAANTVQWLEEIGDQGGFLPGVGEQLCWEL